ncbi:hypothetical protein BGZ75_001692 [Mortierella antarctica]|nr:hypothetical protein BGZ75_001692 [Mortierella antarctica]
MQKGFLNKGQSSSSKKDDQSKAKEVEQSKPKAEEQAKPKAEEPQSREHYEALADKYMQDWAKEMGGTVAHDPETETTRIHSGWQFHK